MSDNQNDDFLDTGDLDDDAGLEDFETGRMSLAEAWKTNPMVKIGGILGAVAIIVGGIILFGGKGDVTAPSVMTTRGGDVKQAPGEKVSEVYADALRQMNEKSVEDALRNQESSLPVPIGSPRGKVLEDVNKGPDEDPLERWRKIQEERLKKEQEVKVTPTEVPQRPVDPYAQEKNALAQSMQAQMQSILESVGPKGPENIVIAQADFLEQEREAEAAKLQEKMVKEGAQDAPVGTIEILLEAGRIEYAQLITEANSDAPGPVLAQLASGPLAGSRLIGTFKKNEEHLTLNFDTIVVDGIAISTEAVALDPKTARPGVITEIDHKYFQRIILPAAAAFVEGIGSAIAESGSTTVTVDGGAAVEESSNLDADQEFFKGVEKASEKIGKILDENGSKVEPMLRVASGTHIGLLFVKGVERRDEVAQKLADEEKKKEQQAQFIPGSPQFLFQVPQGMNPMQMQAPPTLSGAVPSSQ
ncbi:MAG: TrbI/VirB10 family protein [Micavibrio sp.]